MKKEYQDKISEFFPHFSKLLNYIIVKEIPTGSILLLEGDIATKLFLIIRGCLRTYFIKENGIEITQQFFIEGQTVMSFVSAMTETPSRINIDSIEDSIIGIIQVKTMKKVFREHSAARENFNNTIMTRLIHYMNLHASFILDNPEQRYIKFIQDNPELATRLPQQYIASYLGITPVSLSRIRTRLKKQINNC